MKLFILFLIPSVVFAKSKYTTRDLENQHEVNYTEVEKAFMKFGIDTKLISLPKTKLILYYNETKVDFGNKFETKEIVNAPTVSYEADPQSYYSLMMFDIDSPTNKKPYFGELLNWLIVNIPGSELNQADVIAEYAPILLTSKGTHRIIFLLFKQNNRKVFNEDYLRDMYLDFYNRIGFLSTKFQIKYKLEDPIAGNFLQLKYPS